MTLYRVDPLAQWLEHWIFNREDPGSIPREDGIFFQLCFIPVLRLSCCKMGAHPGLDFIRRKWLHVIINDDFLEKGECYERALLPSIICLGRLRIASKYIFNLWQLRQRVDSLAQWLEHWIFNREDRVRFPGKTEYFFSYASILCYGYHVVRSDRGLWREVQNARTITLLSVFMELFPFLIFAILNLSDGYLLKYKSESNETWYIERQPSEIVQSVRTVTVTSNYWVKLLELLPILFFAIISLFSVGNQPESHSRSSVL